MDRPLDWTQYEADESLWVELTLDGATYTVSVARAGVAEGNGCPSEAEHEAQEYIWLADMYDESMACEWCNEARRDGVDEFDVEQHHLDICLTEPVRPLATQHLGRVGRPASMRVGFTKHPAGMAGVETLVPADLEPQELVVTPYEWDTPVESIQLPHEELVRMRWELSESREHRKEVMASV